MYEMWGRGINLRKHCVSVKLKHLNKITQKLFPFTTIPNIWYIYELSFYQLAYIQCAYKPTNQDAAAASDSNFFI